MNALERRLQKMEVKSKQNPIHMTDEERHRRIRELTAKLGVNLDEMIAKYGSLSGFADAVMCARRADEKNPDPSDKRTPMERYMAMLGQSAFADAREKAIEE